MTQTLTVSEETRAKPRARFQRLGMNVPMGPQAESSKKGSATFVPRDARWVVPGSWWALSQGPMNE